MKEALPITMQLSLQILAFPIALIFAKTTSTEEQANLVLGITYSNLSFEHLIGFAQSFVICCSVYLADNKIAKLWRNIFSVVSIDILFLSFSILATVFAGKVV